MCVHFWVIQSYNANEASGTRGDQFAPFRHPHPTRHPCATPSDRTAYSFLGGKADLELYAFSLASHQESSGLWRAQWVRRALRASIGPRPLFLKTVVS